MDLFFNITGPCEPSRHYMLPPMARLPTVRQGIDRGKYLVLHAPRQTGKTTSLITLSAELCQSGYAAAVVSMETGSAFPRDIGAAEDAILADWRRDAGDQLPAELQPPPFPIAPPGSRIGLALSAWARACPHRLVLFLDEIDALKGDLLISVLRQLRSGYRSRPEGFPWSVILCGMRDVRDYYVDLADKDRSHSASPFNIKESLTLRLFTQGEVATLYRQHSAATGQAFTDEALELAFALSGGHPWLVNALGAELTDRQVTERTCAITAKDVERAKEAIIQRQETHLDSLIERLREPRVRRIIEPILIGADLRMDMVNDDLRYVRDLGLITERPDLRIANPIYAEILPRALNYIMQISLKQEVAWYERPDGSLDMILLVAAFQEFFAEHSEAWLGRFDYHEAGPHLMLMAFLQRVTNGGGRITREFAVGSGRADLTVEYGGRRSVLELKLYGGPQTEQKGIRQLSGYLDRLGEQEGHLVIFDRRRGASWADKVYLKEAAGPGGQRIHVFGM